MQKSLQYIRNMSLPKTLRSGYSLARAIKLHSLHIAVLLTIAITVGSIGVGFLVQKNPLLYGIDAWGYQLINGGPHPDWLDWLIKPFNRRWLPVVTPSYYFPMLGGLLLYLLIFKRSLFLWAIFCIFAGTFLASLITALDWKIVFRERPFMHLPNQGLDEAAKEGLKNWNSFPSGHTRETALYSTIIASFIPKLKWVAIAFVIFIAFSRVYTGAHYPTDVIAGGIIGFLTAKVILIISRELQIIQQNLFIKIKSELKHSDKPQ